MIGIINIAEENHGGVMMSDLCLLQDDSGMGRDTNSMVSIVVYTANYL